MSNPLARRQMITTSTAFALIGVIPSGPLLAFSIGEAEALISRAVAEINGIINSGRSEARMLKDFEAVFERYADKAIIGQLVLGADGQTASNKQKSAFAEAFQVYISRKYGRRFREFIGGKIEVQGTRAVKSFYEVTTSAFLAGQAPFTVDFVVADRNGLFIDMKIEGISLVKAERSEIGAMLDKRKGDLDLLIADLRDAG